jgi:hypothetical protein
MPASEKGWRLRNLWKPNDPAFTGDNFHRDFHRVAQIRRKSPKISRKFGEAPSAPIAG